MTRRLSLLSILLSIFLMGCSAPTTAKPPSPTSASQAPTTAKPPSPTSASQAPAPENLGQTLPISAKAIVPNGTTIKLEVAQTPQQQEMGLMHRPALPDDRGMLFPFPSAQPVSFWMKNTPMPLDIVFLHKGVVKYIQAGTPPCASEPCPTYGPRTPIDKVIELRSGRAAELKLKVGDIVKIEF